MATKKDQLMMEVAKAVGAGKAVAMETVDFSDPSRPKTCLEVDFPILPINQVATIEGNAGKPIYQMSKWWARRRSSIFRSMLIAAATKAPEDKSHAAKLVWDNYYANHQKKGAFKHLKVVDIFMGGGTTLVEGSRLGMQMHGNDLNPVAWFVVKQELANVSPEDVKRLLDDIEAEVRPQIMPFYYCDGPNGEKGKWTHVPTARVMGPEFDPLILTPDQRREYKYDGPEIIYTFWAKHGTCQVTGCGHRTPIMTSPVIAVKTITVTSWGRICNECGRGFDVEESAARMAPDVPLYVAPDEAPYVVLDQKRGVVCPHCHHTEIINLGKGTNKRVELSLLMHPQWLAGSSKADSNARPFGGSAQDDSTSTANWNDERSSTVRLLEVRGVLPDSVTCPETGSTWFTDARGGTAALKDKLNKQTKQIERDSDGNPIKTSQQSTFACRADGTKNDVLDAIKMTGKTAPAAAYAIQGHTPNRHSVTSAYNGRFFSPYDLRLSRQYNAATNEWNSRKNSDLAGFWPDTVVEPGLETSVRTPLHKYGYERWEYFFNSRQLLVHALLLRTITTIPGHSDATREIVLAAFQQYLRNNNMFSIWNIQADKLEPFLSKNNMQPPTRPVENGVFGKLGRGNWASCIEGVLEALEWRQNPWELAAREGVENALGAAFGTAKSIKIPTHDPGVQEVNIACKSSTDLSDFKDSSIDLVITDPPFGDIMQYGELSGFFYSWLRLVLKDRYACFDADQTPVALEAVDNASRHGKDGGDFYSRLLTACWTEASRILKPGGILAFTFHHDKDEPWVATPDFFLSES
jgi:putative DNA methylase